MSSSSFNAETGKEIPEEEIDSYEGACDVEANTIIHKSPYGGGGSGAFRDGAAGITEFAEAIYVYQRYRTKDVMHMMF